MRATESELIRQVDKLKEENRVLHQLIASLRRGMREISEVVSEDHDDATSNNNNNDVNNDIKNINLARVSGEVETRGRGRGQPYVPATDARSIPPEATSKEPPATGGGGGDSDGRWLPWVLDELRVVDRSLIELRDRLERARLGSEKR